MLSPTHRELYDEAWHQLVDLIARRSALLRSLDTMARLAMQMNPASGLVIEFDVSRAEQLVARVEQLTGEISAVIQTVNKCAERCGAPTVKWQNVALRFEN